MSEGTTDSLPTDPSLLRRMRTPDDSDAWEEFHGRYHGFIQGLAARHGLSEHDAKDLEQLVLLGLVENIMGFKPRTRPRSFRRWLSQRVRWRIMDFLRARRSDREDPLSHHHEDGEGVLPELVQEAVDLAEVMERDQRIRLVHRALGSLPSRISPKNIQAFEMVILQEASPEHVAKLLQMTRPSIYLACHRVEKALRRRLAQMVASGPNN